MADYSNYTKEELLKLIARQEKELKNKKYGLVWDAEREPEQVVLDCENNLPVLERIKEKEIRSDDNEDNILIEGDNYHALTVLNYTHKGKIDAIYIDPPYNTGKDKEWKYNDRFIDENDGFRHSKWLNLFEKRLKLAKKLLKENGIVFISIDDNELAQSKLVCDKIFNGNASRKETNFLAILVWDLGTGTQAGHFVRSHEYILVYSNNKSLFPNFKGGNGIIKHSALKKISKKNPKSDFIFPTGFRFDAADNVELKGSWGGAERTTLVSGQMICLDGQLVNEVTLSAGWAMKSQMKNWIIDKDNTFDSKGQKVLEFYFNKNGVLTYRKERRATNPPTILRNIASTKKGSNELQEIFQGEKVFDFPKPSILIKELLSYLPNDITVLDYFAGTGTTGHAVLQLNKEDSGTRKFIICTNNESNICTEVTYPRLHKVINGYNKHSNGDFVEELGGNLQYFKTSLIKKMNNRDQVKVDLTRRCTEMICVKENIFNLLQEVNDFKIFSSNKSTEFLCIYYNFIEDTFEDFLNTLKGLNGKKYVYMFSIENEIDNSLFADIENAKIEAIPQNILDVYKQLVKMNISIKSNLIFTDLNKAKNRVFRDKDKDDGARILRVVLEKTIQRISQSNSINILNARGKEEKLSILNNKLYYKSVISKIEWAQNKNYLIIGNNAAHGEYDDYDLEQVVKFYKHVQTLLNNYGV